MALRGGDDEYDESRVEEFQKSSEERTDTTQIFELTFFVALVGILIMVISFIRGEKDEPPGFEKITDPVKRRWAAIIMDTGDSIDLHLSEDESTTLPSGTVIKKTADGFIIEHK